jgi:hypothetical protein
VETPAAVLDRLRGVVADAAAIPLSCWNRDELADWVCGLQTIRAQVDGLVCAAAAEADNAAIQSLDGVRTLRQLVAGRTHTNPADVGADLSLGRWLRTYPTIADALSTGRITRRHALHLRDLDNPRSHRHLIEAQDYLTTAAADCSWDGFTETCARWLANADPDGRLADERRHTRRATLKRHADGTTTGTFRLDTIEGAAITTAIEHETLRLFRLDADPTNPDARHRTHAQRTADALVNLITRGATRLDTTTAAPLVHVVVGLDILEEAIAREAAAETGTLPTGPDGNPLPHDLGIDPHDPRRRCELIDRTPVHPKQVLGLLSIATLRRLVLDADNEILDLGRSVRNFPRHLKQALLAANRGRCTEAHCDAPPTWLEADHIVPWSPSGITATSNGQILCKPANHAKSNHPHHAPHTSHAPSTHAEHPPHPDDRAGP